MKQLTLPSQITLAWNAFYHAWYQLERSGELVRLGVERKTCGTARRPGKRSCCIDSFWSLGPVPWAGKSLSTNLGRPSKILCRHENNLFSCRAWKKVIFMPGIFFLFSSARNWRKKAFCEPNKKAVQTDARDFFFRHRITHLFEVCPLWILIWNKNWSLWSFLKYFFIHCFR